MLFLIYLLIFFYYCPLAPDFPPKNVKLNVVNFDSIQIDWDEVDPESIAGVIRGFTVFWKAIYKEDDFKIGLNTRTKRSISENTYREGLSLERLVYHV